MFFIAAAAASGTTVVTGAGELRVKESDRLAVMAAGLTTLGIECELLADGLRLSGGRIGGGRTSTVTAITGSRWHSRSQALLAGDTIEIDDVANVATSFPGLPQLARAAGGCRALRRG